MNGRQAAAREHYVLDGYNVINAWPELIALRDNLEYARDRLIDIMAEYGAFWHYDITIVFDALFTADRVSRNFVNSNLEIVFTDEDETADAYIEKITYILVRSGKEVHVVTSDAAEQFMILGAGAYRMSSAELLRDVKLTRRKIADEYTGSRVLPLRQELGSRIHADIAKKMDELRKKR